MKRSEQQLFGDFIRHKSLERCKKEFLKKCDWVLLEYFDFCLSINRPIQDVRLNEARRFRAYLLNAALQPGTVNGYISIVRVFYNYLVFIEEIGLNPFRLLEQIHVMPTDPHYIPMAQMKKIFESLNAGYFVAILHITIFECMYATGITGMELMYMCPEDFNFELESLTIRATKKKPRRDVPIPAQSILVIKQYLAYRKIHHPLATFFIVSKTGKKLYYGLINTAINTLLNGTAVRGSKRNRGVATIKNTFRQNLLFAGVKIETIGKLTGKRMKALARHSGWRFFADLKRNHSLYHPRG